MPPKPMWSRVISIVLTLSMTFTMLPLSAFATNTADTTLHQLELSPGPDAVTDSRFGEAETPNNVTSSAVSSTVVAEDPSKRDQFQKDFLLSDNTHLLVVYPEAVHYQKDGAWVDIDNTLIPKNISGQQYYTNTAGGWAVRLPETLSADQGVQVSKGDYKLEFSLIEVENKVEPTPQPSAEPTPEPTLEPTPEPTLEPTPEPTSEATPPPSSESTSPSDTQSEIFATPASTPALEQPQDENLNTSILEDSTLEFETTDEVINTTIVENTQTATDSSTDSTGKITTEVSDSAQNAPETHIESAKPSTIFILESNASTFAAASSQWPETVPTQLNSAAYYPEVLSNADIQYDLASEQLKESIILNSKPEAEQFYRFALTVENVDLVLQSDGSIYAFASDKGSDSDPVFVLPAPNMIDANQEQSFEISVSLEPSENGYILTYAPSYEWLSAADRAYPVILDPVVDADLTSTNIQDQNVCSTGSFIYTSMYIECGRHSSRGIERSFLKYNSLPTLTSADVVVDARIALYRPYNSSVVSQMEVYEVMGDWDSTTITWANKPEYSENITDYQMVSGAAWYVWEITNIARKWYEGENYGLMFKLPNAVENDAASAVNKTFYSSDAGASYRPVMYITYVNNDGIEGFWDYETYSAGRAGTGYMNTFTGNLTWVLPDLGFSGNRMPVSIEHVYNASSKEDGNLFGMGNAWRTNYNQIVYSKVIGSETYYIWEDEDGTSHYFSYSSTNTYKDELGTELTLTINNSGSYPTIITDKNGNKSYFDGQGRLAKIENNQATKSSITISYIDGTSKLISTITDGVGRVYAFTYSNNLLTKMAFKGTGSTEITSLSYGYSGNRLTSVAYPDGKTISYQYATNWDGTETNLLSRATDVDGYYVQCDYTTLVNGHPSRIYFLEVNDKNQSSNDWVMVTYATNATGMYRYHDGQQADSVVRTFNDWGNLISIQTDEGRAEYAEYAQDSNPEAKANQLVLSSKLQNTVKNFIVNSSFEYGDHWTVYYWGNPGPVNYGYTTADKYVGNRSFYIARQSSDWGMYLLQQSPDAFFTLEPGKTYTFSAYVKTVGMDGTGEGASLLLESTYSGGPSSKIANINTSQDWTRYELTYTVPYNLQSNQFKVTVQLASAGTVYFDGLQFEESATASRYNLIENGDFQWTNGSESSPYGWTGSSTTSSDGRILYEDPTVDILDDYALQIVGSTSAQKGYYQDVPISGSAGDVFTVAGWANAYGAPLEDCRTGIEERRFALKVVFYNTDNTQTTKYIDFNPDTESWYIWQFLSKRIIADKAYNFIRVMPVYEKNVNIAYFDGIQMFKEEFGHSYVYDANGNVTSVTDLQKETTTYEYTSNNLTSMTLPTGAKQTYTYDGHHNVLTSTSDMGVTANFTYDTYGNNTKVSLGNSTPIESSAVYTTDGNYPVSVTDEMGKTTTYGYDTTTGLLSWVQAPGDSASTRTEYEYDNMYRTTEVSKAVSGLSGGLNGVVNSYTYSNDLLTHITHSNTSSKSTTYEFLYNDFSLLTAVKVGDRTLVSHTYTTDGYYNVSTTTYGNGDWIGYVYDEYGRLVSSAPEEDPEAETIYRYDNNGNLAVIIDEPSGITTKYHYDLSDRLIRTEETGSDFTHSFQGGYDDLNNLTSVTETLNGTTYVTDYAYDDDNRVTDVTNGSVKSSYAYDAYSRLNSVVAKYNNNAVVIQTITYNSKNSSHQALQVATCKNQVGSTSTTYSYTYDDNGNITSVSDGTHTTSYVYDGLNQLTRENNQKAGKTWTYTYDAGGNITEKKEYNYTTGTLGTELDMITYTYGDSTWGDLLTGYDGQTLTTDEIGNLTYDGIWTYEWSEGRQLDSMTEFMTMIVFRYNQDGLRTQKLTENSAWSFYYSGTTLTHMTDGVETLHFSYDSTGLVSVNYNGDEYFYIKNMQGDVVALADTSGQIVVEYTYDAWGRPLGQTGSMSLTLGFANPFQYRGYFYDWETGLYYVNSRYYNPKTGRFINADNLSYLGKGSDLASGNLFTYCGNNPVSRKDCDGNVWETVFDVASLGISIVEIAVNPADPWAWAGLVGDVVDLIPYVTNVGETVRAVKTTSRLVDKSNDVVSAAKKIANKVSASTGSYEILYASGKNYVGKGGFSRAIQSAINHTKPSQLNKAGDTVVSIVWKASDTPKNAFLEEFALQTIRGVNNPSTYNKIWSPGKKYALSSGIIRGFTK